MRAAVLRAIVLLTFGVPAFGQAATSSWTTVAIPGGWATVEEVGLTDDDRAHTLLVLTRLLHANPTGASDQEVAAMRRLTGAMARPAPRAGPVPPRAADVPVLLTPDHWSDVLGARVTAARLFEAMVQDRAAMLLHYGLAGADPQVRALVASNRDFLRWIHRNAPGAIALAGASLGMEGGAIAVPGGPEAEPLWEALTGEPPRQPEAFLRALLSRDRGRLAWFFDTLTQVDDARLAVVLGPAERREERVRALYQAFLNADPNWTVEARPFLRTQADGWMIVREVAVDDGRVAPPNDAGLWTYVFGRTDLSAPPDAASLRLTGRPVTLDWLAREITAAQLRERRDRYEVVLFAQRVFGDAPAGRAADMAFTLVNFRRYRALMLSLERLGLDDPADYASLVLAARHTDGMPGVRRRDAIVAFQGALALATRARWAGTLDRAAAVTVVTTLARDVAGAPDVPMAVARWLTRTFTPALPRLTNPDALTGRTAYEARILQGLAGVLDAPGRAAIEWEGLDYVVDPAAAEFERLRDARSRLASPGLDAAIAHPRAFGLADALLTLVYVTALGDPAGPAFFSRDVAARHDFGLDSPSSQRRAVVPWTVPYEMVGDGGPWRGVGALMGLDLAMARLALRRIHEQDMPQAPTIGANEAQVLARTVALLSPRAFTDQARDELAAAVQRGRARVDAARDNLDHLDHLAAEAGVSPSTRALVPWIAEHEPERLETVFARRDLMWLGRPALAGAKLDRWGAYAEPLIGCLCVRMPRPEPWERHGGRTDTGQMASQTVDLLLRLVEETAAMGLPAALLPSLMAYAVQDQIHDVVARVQDDWPATVRAAARLPRTRVEDYVAALAGTVLRSR